MPKFELGLKKVEYGYAIVQAKDVEEAKQKFKCGEITASKMFPGQDVVLMDGVEIKPEDQI
jgi:hypothetical protein